MHVLLINIKTAGTCMFLYVINHEMCDNCTGRSTMQMHSLASMVETNINFLYMQKVKIMTCSFQNWSFNCFFIQCLQYIYVKANILDHERKK